MSEGRAKIAVYVDLDSTPGGMSAETARNVVRGVLDQTASQYRPLVTVEAENVSAPYIGKDDCLHRLLDELELARRTLQETLDSYQPCKEDLDRVLEVVDFINEFRNI